MLEKWLASAVALVLILLAPSRADAAATRRMWLAWQQGTQSCQGQVESFFNCILGQTNFNDLAAGFPGQGERLTLAGTKVINCGPTDWGCIVSQGGFAIGTDDLVMYYHGAGQGCTTGHNFRNVVVNGVSIRTSEIQTDAVCTCQTALGMHEAYEAAGDQADADCCNGQVFGALSPGCAQFGGTHGWYDLSCGGQTYKAQLVSSAQSITDPNNCQKLVPACQGGGVATDLPCTATSQCCAGLECKNWSYSGQPPFSTFCCAPVAGNCSSSTDCCGGSNCNGTTHKCECVAKDQWCINADECCGGLTCDLNAKKCVPLTVPQGVKRHVSSAGFSAWNFAASSVDPIGDAALAAIVDGDALPDAPALIKANDGSPQIWLVDGAFKRYVPSPQIAAAWKLDLTKAVLRTAAQVAALPKAADLRSAPFLVKGTAADVFLIDDALPASGDGGTGGAGAGVDGGGRADAGGADAGTLGDTPPGGAPQDGGPAPGGCACRAANARSPHSLFLAIGVAGLLLVRRRARHERRGV